MRYSAYEFSDDDYVYLHLSQQLIEASMPKNAKPYQKINTSGEDIIEYQMPAYFMQYIAYCMHGGFPILIWDNTDIGFATVALAKRYSNPRKIIKDRNGLIKFPHYLETYYLLTKRIIAIDFK